MELSSGERIDIMHPDQAFVTTTGSVILLTPGEPPGTYQWRLIGLDHILGLSKAHVHEANGE
jgi:hypothetical protein